MKQLLLPPNESRIHVALALLRIGIGAMFIFHGLPKLFGGPALWAQLGQAMNHVGIGFAPTFWGLAAALAEALGGFALILGLGTRLASAALLFTMIIASLLHLANGEGFNGASHAIEDGIVFLALLICGAGRHSIDQRLTGSTSTAV